MILGDMNLGVSLDQRVQEAQGYHSLLQEQLAAITSSLNGSEEAKQLNDTIKTMMEALRQCIDMVKDNQLTGIATPPLSLESSPPPDAVPEEEEPVPVKATPTTGGATASSSETSSELR